MCITQLTSNQGNRGDKRSRRESWKLFDPLDERPTSPLTTSLFPDKSRASANKLAAAGNVGGESRTAKGKGDRVPTDVAPLRRVHNDESKIYRLISECRLPFHREECAVEIFRKNS